MSAALRTATPAEAASVWPAVRAAHLFEERAAFVRYHAAAPWRVQVTDRGEAALVERWRTHLDVLAIRGLWCSAAQVPAMVGALARLATLQGFGRVLSPLVPQEVVGDYERAGMRRHSGVVALVRQGEYGPAPVCRLPQGVSTRLALAADLDAIVELDAGCFDEFWRYDHERLATYFSEDRIRVAEENGRIIGYTLCTSTEESGSVGRLAVARSARRRGLARALLAEALGAFSRAGIERVSLCTQEENDASQALYRDAGFRESAGRLVFLIGPAAPIEDKG